MCNKEASMGHTPLPQRCFTAGIGYKVVIYLNYDDLEKTSQQQREKIRVRIYLEAMVKSYCLKLNFINENLQYQ